MPLPEILQTAWPPPNLDKVFRWYREHAAWYAGDPEQLADVYAAIVYTDTNKGRFWSRQLREERRTMVHVPIAGDIAATSADLLFSEAPRIIIPEAHAENASAEAKDAQARLDDLVQLAGVHNRLLEGAETAAAMGGVFLRANWDREVVDHPILSIIQADAAVPDFRWGHLVAATFWRELFDGKNSTTVYRHLERHEIGPDGRGVIFHGLYRGTDTTLGRQLPLAERPETTGLEPVVTMPFDGLAVRYVPNMRPNRRFRGLALGQSDYAGIEGLMDSLDEVYTSWLRDIRLGAGRLIAPEEWLELRDGKFKFDLDQEVFAALNVDPKSAEKAGLTINQFEIRAEEHEKSALALLERIISAAGYSPQSFGLHIEGRAESGTALRIRERKSLTTKAKKERYWRAPTEEILQLLLVIDREIFGRSTPVLRPRLEYADSIAGDPMETARSVEMIARAQAASTQTLVRMLHPDWQPAEVAAEVERILKERGVATAPFEGVP